MSVRYTTFKSNILGGISIGPILRTAFWFLTAIVKSRSQYVSQSSFRNGNDKDIGRMIRLRGIPVQSCGSGVRCLSKFWSIIQWVVRTSLRNVQWVLRRFVYYRHRCSIGRWDCIEGWRSQVVWQCVCVFSEQIHFYLVHAGERMSVSFSKNICYQNGD